MSLLLVLATTFAFCQSEKAGLGLPSAEKEKTPAALYQAYWLIEIEKESHTGYQKLLLTRGLLEEIAGPRWRSGHSQRLPFDSMAMVFATCGRDSLWTNPFQIVKSIGEMDSKAKIVVVDEVKYRYESCSVKELIRLLEKPLGTNRGIHRPAHPLAGAEITTRAFLLLLKDQSASAK